MFISHGIHVEG